SNFRAHAVQIGVAGLGAKPNLKLHAVWNHREKVSEIRRRLLGDLRRLRIVGLGDLDPYPLLPRTSKTKIGKLLCITDSGWRFDLELDIIAAHTEGDRVKFGKG